ncbi:MAG: TAXI family TRAP transporter solute-binding subunit [Eubacteriales bacterium]|nr:TAXI family TRAP transporter solute-binding subunit [Eubacteriales bacterium]
MLKKEFKKLISTVVAVGIAAVSLTGCSQGSTRMMFGTGGTAGTYYSYGGVIAQYMGTYADAKVTAVSTGGSKVNIQSIQDGDFQLGFTQSDVMAYAWSGTKSFEQDGATHDFRVLGGLYDETVQLITMDEDIDSVDDLKGKSVSIGQAGSGVYFNAVDVLSAAGITLDDIHPQYQSFEDSKESLKDGKIDAAFIVAGAPTTAITELATTNGVYLVNIDGDLREDILNSCPYYSALQIPADTYPGQPDPVETITVKATVVVAASADEDLVYNLTAAIFDHADEIAKENAKGAELNAENAVKGMAAPFHKGAAKYYAEHGITVNTDENAVTGAAEEKEETAEEATEETAEEAEASDEA